LVERHPFAVVELRGQRQRLGSEVVGCGAASGRDLERVATLHLVATRAAHALVDREPTRDALRDDLLLELLVGADLLDVLAAAARTTLRVRRVVLLVDVLGGRAPLPRVPALAARLLAVPDLLLAAERRDRAPPFTQQPLRLFDVLLERRGQV